MCLKINWSVKRPWHRPSIGVTRSGLWAPEIDKGCYRPRFLEYFRSQYVFRKNHSTGNALVQLYDKLLYATDQGKVTLGLIINLSKAFDTVNHDILLGTILDNLEFYRVRVSTLQCFKSCLLELSLNGTLYGYNSFSKYTLLSSAPRVDFRSCMFLLYINDLYNFSERD